VSVPERRLAPDLPAPRLTAAQRTAARDSRQRRDRVTRTGELRRTLRVGSPVVGIVLFVTGVLLAVRFPDHSALLFGVWAAAAAGCLGLFLVAPRATERSVAVLTVLLTVFPAVGLLVSAVEPGALLAVSSGFSMLPVAVPLFLAWTTALRTVWLVVYSLILGGATVLTGLGHLDTAQRADLAANVVIGSVLGWFGGELLERLRARSLDQGIELRRLNHELRIGATTDALTGLANRRQLESDLAFMTRARGGVAARCAFVMLDLDRFKRLNDDLGHAVGDEALRRVSATLRTVIRGRDTIYRYGGEEFLVILPDSTLEAATIAAERIRLAVAALGIDGSAGPDPTTLTISCGVALSPIEPDAWEYVIADADSALYEAKATGRNRVSVMPESPQAQELLRRDRRERRAGRGRTGS
jgi:diguanylate cyclase (GGDEF)-like protein